MQTTRARVFRQRDEYSLIALGASRGWMRRSDRETKQADTGTVGVGGGMSGGRRSDPQGPCLGTAECKKNQENGTPARERSLFFPSLQHGGLAAVVGDEDVGRVHANSDENSCTQSSGMGQ